MRARTMKSDSRSFRSGNALNATPDVGTVTSTGARPGRSASGKRSDSARTGKSFGSLRAIEHGHRRRLEAEHRRAGRRRARRSSPCAS